MKFLRRVGCVAVVWPALALGQQFTLCGDLGNAFGPYDYRTERGNPLHLVESAHFTPAVETLIRGNTTNQIGGDIDYTLRAFPNHHRALLSMMRLGERMKLDKVPAASYSVDCYFDRAVRFRPDDTTARLLYATYLGKANRLDDARRQVERAVQLAGDNGYTHYNAGLTFLELKMPDKALQEAHMAAALGFERPGLRESLKAAGKWREPNPAAMAAMAASVAASGPTKGATPAAPASLPASSP